MSSSPKTFHLELEADSSQAGEVIKVVLNAILFHRLTHLTEIEEANFFGINYSVLSGVREEVKAAGASFTACVERGAEDTSVILSLFERKRSETFEEWTIKLNLHRAESEQQRIKLKNLIVKQLRACLLYISSVNVTETLHIPLLNNPSSKAQFKITIPAAKNNESWAGLFKKMIQDATIPSLLK